MMNMLYVRDYVTKGRKGGGGGVVLWEQPHVMILASNPNGWSPSRHHPIINL